MWGGMLSDVDIFLRLFWGMNDRSTKMEARGPIKRLQQIMVSGRNKENRSEGYRYTGQKRKTEDIRESRVDKT